MNYIDIKEAYNQDLCNILNSQEPEIIWIKPFIKAELDIRSIINTTVGWGAHHIAALENRTMEAIDHAYGITQVVRRYAA